jgi:hypothetical protein
MWSFMGESRAGHSTASNLCAPHLGAPHCLASTSSPVGRRRRGCDGCASAYSATERTGRCPPQRGCLSAPASAIFHPAASCRRAGRSAGLTPVIGRRLELLDPTPLLTRARGRRSEPPGSRAISLLPGRRPSARERSDGPIHVPSQQTAPNYRHRPRGRRIVYGTLRTGSDLMGSDRGRLRPCRQHHESRAGTARIWLGRRAAAGGVGRIRVKPVIRRSTRENGGLRFANPPL